MFQFTIEEMPVFDEERFFRFEIGQMADGAAVWYQGMDRPRVRRVFSTYERATIGEPETETVEEDIDVEVVISTFEDAAKTIFGDDWQTILEQLLDLRDAGTWRRNLRLPPPRIVAWIGYLASSPYPRKTGIALLSRSVDPTVEDITRAILAWEGRPA